MKIIVLIYLLLFSFEVSAQTLPSFLEMERQFNNTKNSEEMSQYRFMNKKKDGIFKLFCFQNGIAIERYSNLDLVKFESKFLYYDVETKSGQTIRVPSGSCFVETNTNK